MRGGEREGGSKTLTFLKSNLTGAIPHNPRLDAYVSPLPMSPMSSMCMLHHLCLSISLTLHTSLTPCLPLPCSVLQLLPH